MTFTACSSNWKRKIPFAVSVNFNGIFMREREKEREAESITYLFFLPKGNRFLRTPKLVCCIAGFGRVSFFCSLQKKRANASLQRIILYIYVLLNDMIYKLRSIRAFQKEFLRNINEINTRGKVNTNKYTYYSYIYISLNLL